MAAVTVGVAAVRLDTVNETDNRAGSTLVFQPTDGTIYYGKDNTVTVASGIPVASGATVKITFDDAVQACWAIAAGNVNVRKEEWGV